MSVTQNAELPPITVVMTLFLPPTEGGFARGQAARQTVISWGRHMRYAGPLRLHVANDSLAELDPEANDIVANYSRWPTTRTDTRGAGLGGAFNAGFRAAFDVSPLALYADDSYSLVEDLDLTPWAKVLLNHDDIGAVGLMPPRPEQQGGRVVYCHNIETEGVAGVVFDRAGYNWQGRPLLYHERFFKHYGATPEGVSGYAWETTYAATYNERADGPVVMYAFLDPFQHVWGGVRLGDKPPGWSGAERA